MKSLWRLSVIGVLLAGCQASDVTPGKGDGGTPPGDPYAACTDPQKCCSTTDPDHKMTCVGDPDGKIVCTCKDLWDCSKNPKKCDQALPTPPGGGDWSCQWTEFKYTCTKSVPPGTPPGDNPQDLPGGGDWVCTYKDKEFKWECTTTPPNPANNPNGTTVWKCTVDAATGKLVCERTDTSTPPTGSGVWNCTTVNGKKVCTKQDENGGLPPGGSNWKCNQVMKNGVVTWVCYGDSETPPGGNGWECTKIEGEFNKWKCEKPDSSSDTPPGGGWYACTKGSEFGGTKCEETPTQPTPPTPQPKPGDKCLIGDKMWCDGLQYCGWGQVQCDPATNKWKTKKDATGTEILDCQELSTGERPNTVCACYHFFFNPACCERPDCLVPAGSNGQICPASKGQLCDYCNPIAGTDCKETGAKCIVTNAHETFCGRLCSPQAPCPGGYTCMLVKLQGNQTTNQCVPADFSCYY